MHFRTAFELTGVRIHRRGYAERQALPAWRYQYDKLPRVLFHFPEPRLDSGTGCTTGSYRY